ncbi:MAG TPA: hypothetical protein ENN38_04570 [Actinobacteria bacterium]|nr:hypothetical protein [Actinomycetota bacterium]
MEGKSIKKGRKVSQMLFHTIAFLFLFGFTAYLFKPFLQAGFPPGFDSIGHCFKIKYIADMLIKYGRFVDWWEPWYCGHHLLLFYPPLSYLVPVILQIILKDPAVVGKISVFFGVFLAAINMYLLAFVLLEEKKNGIFRTIAAVGGAAAYAFSPIFIHFSVEAGYLSDLYAMVLAPLCFILLIRWLRRSDCFILVSYALVLAAIFFLHGIVASLIGLGSFLFVLVYLLSAKIIKSSKDSIFKGVYFFVLALVLFVSLTAVWWIPYFAQIGKTGTGIVIDPLLPMNSLPLRYFFRRGIIKDVGTIYMGFCVVLLSISALFFRQRRAEAFSFWAMFLLGLVICLGFNTPIYQRIPVVNIIWPERGMMLCIISSACLVALSLAGFTDKIAVSGARQQFLKCIVLVLGLFLIFLMIWDFSCVFDRIYTVVISPSLKGTFDYLEERPKDYGDRIALVGARNTGFASAPFLTGFGDINGYLYESSKNAWPASYVTSDALIESNSRFFLRKYDIFNVNYVVVEKKKELELKNLLATKKFENVYENDQYLILKYLESKGFVQPLALPTLIIGEKPDYLIDILSINNDIRFVEGKEKLDDYLLDDLRSFDSVILYDFKALNLPVVEKVLKDYVEGGGTLIVDTDGTSFKNGDMLSIKSMEKDFSGPVKAESSKGELGSFSPAIYEGGSWRGVYYDGLDENWLTIDGKYPVAGVKRIGEGKAVFLGFNLFFHAAYYDNLGEKIYLRELIRPLLDGGGGNLSYKIVSVKPGEKKIEVDVSEPTWAMVSMSWSPYWYAFVDGKEQRVYPCENLISLKLPTGIHELKFKYVTTKIHYLAGGISLFSLVMAIVFMFKTRKKRIG